MKLKNKILWIFAGISIIIFCLIFVFNTNNISTLINYLNNENTNSITTDILYLKVDDKNNIRLVNSPALGKYKINVSSHSADGYTNINEATIYEKCTNLINTNNKVVLISQNNNLDNEYFVAILQMVAGDDYEHISNFFATNFTGVDKDIINNNLNNYFSTLFNINISDFPYINLKKNATNYLLDNGLNDYQIEELIAKLKENCE